MTDQPLTPQQVLDSYPALTMTQLAYVLQLTHRSGKNKGQPHRLAAVRLCQEGRIPLIDPDAYGHRWMVSAADVRAYLARSSKAQARQVQRR